MGQDRPPEALGQLQVDRNLEEAAPTGEVLVDLAGDVVDPPRRAEDAGADGGGQLHQHVVMVLALEGHPHEPGRGGGQEQRADGAVHGAVGDVEQAIAVGLLGQAGPQPGERRVVRPAPAEVVDELAIRLHGRGPSRSAGGGWRCRRRRCAGRPPGCTRAARRPRRRAGRPDTGTRPRPAAWAAARPGRRAARCRPAPGPGSPAVNALGDLAGRHRHPDPGPDLVDRLVVGDRHQPAPHVASRPQLGIGPQGGQKRLRPGVVGLDRPEQGAADPHHHLARARPRSLQTVASPHLVNERRGRPVRSAPILPIQPVYHA